MPTVPKSQSLKIILVSEDIIICIRTDTASSVLLFAANPNRGSSQHATTFTHLFYSENSVIALFVFVPWLNLQRTLGETLENFDLAPARA